MRIRISTDRRLFTWISIATAGSFFLLQRIPQASPNSLLCSLKPLNAAAVKFASLFRCLLSVGRVSSPPLREVLFNRASLKRKETVRRRHCVSYAKRMFPTLLFYLRSASRVETEDIVFFSCETLCERRRAAAFSSAAKEEQRQQQQQQHSP